MAFHGSCYWENDAFAHQLELTVPERSVVTRIASVIVSDVPVVVQNPRLDSRQAANALLSTIAHAAS